MNNVLVIGGCGFIGSNLCKSLIDVGIKVTSFDNYFTGSKNNHVEGVTYIKGNSAEISSLIDFTPDYIYHLGEYSRVEQSFEDIELVWKFNKDGIFAVLEFCRKTKAKLIKSIANAINNTKIKVIPAALIKEIKNVLKVVFRKSWTSKPKWNSSWLYLFSKNHEDIANDVMLKFVRKDK